MNYRDIITIEAGKRGGKPGEMPFEQPTLFDFGINLKTAKALGIKVPQTILIQATKVIE